MKLKNFISWIMRNIVLVTAVFAAAVTSFIIPPDKTYITYFDFKTLACLFCVLAVVCAFKNINFFYILAKKIIKCFKNIRMAIIALVYITFIGSMFIANDMALLTFLPLGYFVLKSTKNEQYMAFTFIMQNIAANLGGMLTPFGNPQNLYIYSKFNIPNCEFMKIMFPPFIIAIAMITVCCLFIKNKPLEIKDEPVDFSKKKAFFYLLLFVLSIAVVFRSIPYQIGFIIITPCIFFADKKALKDVDYPLLLTFAAFFVFSGNMSRITAVQELFEFLLSKSTLLVSAFSCQIISNVPTAILLSQFTNNYKDLLLGVNIGGTGTLIASLASLITLREFTKHYPKETGKYIKMFSIYNFGFLIILLLAMMIIY